ASRSTIHHSFVSRLLAGECTTLSADRAARMAEVLGVRPAVLFRPIPTNNKRTHIKHGDAK
ncbi:helix-turn-helix transcriptional regulator, partial [Mycobacterium sp. 1245801.1]